MLQVVGVVQGCSCYAGEFSLFNEGDEEEIVRCRVHIVFGDPVLLAEFCICSSSLGMTYEWDGITKSTFGEYFIYGEAHQMLWKRLQPSLRRVRRNVSSNILGKYSDDDIRADQTLPIEDVTWQDLMFYYLHEISSDLRSFFRGRGRVSNDQVGCLLQVTASCSATGMSPEMWYDTRASDELKASLPLAKYYELRQGGPTFPRRGAREGEFDDRDELDPTLLKLFDSLSGLNTKFCGVPTSGISYDDDKIKHRMKTVNLGMAMHLNRSYVNVFTLMVAAGPAISIPLSIVLVREGTTGRDNCELMISHVLNLSRVSDVSNRRVSVSGSNVGATFAVDRGTALESVLAALHSHGFNVHNTQKDGSR